MIWINRPKQNCRQLANWYEKILFKLGILGGIEDDTSKKELKGLIK